MKRAFSGFTLAELLIALVILGVIATFTIPKVLQSQQDSKYKAMGKEVASMFAGAYTSYKQQNTVDVNLTPVKLTPYMNYVAVDSASIIDSDPFWSMTFDCSQPNFLCLRLHNGGTMVMRNDITFGNTASTNMIWVEFDPDSQASSVKAVNLYITYPGRLTSFGPTTTTVCNSGLCAAPGGPASDPSWFGWN